MRKSQVEKVTLFFLSENFNKIKSLSMLSLPLEGGNETSFSRFDCLQKCFTKQRRSSRNHGVQMRDIAMRRKGDKERGKKCSSPPIRHYSKKELWINLSEN